MYTTVYILQHPTYPATPSMAPLDEETDDRSLAPRSKGELTKADFIKAEKPEAKDRQQ